MTKTVKLTIRLSPEDMALLKSRTAKTRLSQSAYLRMLIRGYAPKVYPPDIYFEVLQKLNQAGGAVADPVISRCQRQSEIVRKRRRNFVVFRRGEW